LLRKTADEFPIQFFEKLEAGIKLPSRDFHSRSLIHPVRRLVLFPPLLGSRFNRFAVKNVCG
jgi:hypothetical protein